MSTNFVEIFGHLYTFAHGSIDRKREAKAMTTTTDNVQPIVDKAKAHDKGNQDFSDVYKGIVQLQQQDKNPAQFSKDLNQLNTSLHQAGILTDLQITGVDGSNHFEATKDGKQVDVVASNVSDTFQPGTQNQSWLKGFENVAGDVLKGVGSEIVNHPLHLAESAAIGVAIGVGAVGAAAISPWLAGGLAVAGGIAAGYELATNVGQWDHDAKVVANPLAYSQNEVSAAVQGAENFGAGAINVLAGVAGSYAGGYVGGAIKSAIVAKFATPDVVPPEPTPDTNVPDDNTSDVPKSKGSIGHAHAQQGNVVNATGKVGDPSHAVNGSIPVDHSHAMGGLLQGNPGDGSDGDAVQPALSGEAQPAADAPVAEPKPADVTPAAAAPKDAAATAADTQAQAEADAAAAKAAQAKAIEESVARTQALFKEANSGEGDGVIPSTKQDYSVMFQKVTEPGKIPTLENPAGADVKPGQWIATRLNPDGTPNIEKGMVNQWTVTDKDILKTYKATPDEVSTASKFVAATKTDAPPVHMVKLTAPLTINTSWGPMNGNPNDYLANYDYDPVTGQPGENYAIVSSSSYGQTYEPVKTNS
jgi:hypothetical protein